MKVLLLVYPALVETDEEALERHARMVSTPAFLARALANASINSDIDFAQFDLDTPIPKLEGTASQGALDEFDQHGSGKTLRQLVIEKYDGGGVRFIGLPDRVAARMEGVVQEAAVTGS